MGYTADNNPGRRVTDIDFSSVFGPRHVEGCENCAKPTTEAGRELAAQFHGWPSDPKHALQYPWNLLDGDDIVKIEQEAARAALERVAR